METSRFPLAALEPGMILSADILRDEAVLIEAGTEITERHIKQLTSWGLTEIEVRGNYPSIDRIARRTGEAEEIEVVDLSAMGLAPAEAKEEAAAIPMPKGYEVDNGATYVVESAPTEGEVTYDGGLIFQGGLSPKESLVVRAAGPIKVMGDCVSEKGSLRIESSKGDVEIDGVARGAGVEVVASGSVRSKAFSHARVRAEEAVEVLGEEGKIEGGSIEAGRRIRAGIAGNLKYDETNLTITMSWLKRAFLEVQRIQKRIAERQAEVEKLKKVIELVRMLGEKVATLDPERKASLAMQTKQFIEATAEIKELTQKLDTTRQTAMGEVTSVEDCPLVLGRAYPNVKITIGPSSLHVNAKNDRIGYYLKEKRILAKTEGV